jgi:hypothetical protein
MFLHCDVAMHRRKKKRIERIKVCVVLQDTPSARLLVCALEECAEHHGTQQFIRGLVERDAIWKESQ